MLDKDKIVNALNAIQNGADGTAFHDELEATIGVLMEVGEDLIAKVVEDIHEDCDSENSQN